MCVYKESQESTQLENISEKINFTTKSYNTQIKSNYCPLSTSASLSR